MLFIVWHAPWSQLFCTFIIFFIKWLIFFFIEEIIVLRHHKNVTQWSDCSIHLCLSNLILYWVIFQLLIFLFFVKKEKVYIYIYIYIYIYTYVYAQQAQSKECNTYIVKSWIQSNAPILFITTMALWWHAGYGWPVAEFTYCLEPTECSTSTKQGG